ncbi:hypothetical protein OKA05_21250 [Luteolibacter arcticus]|uniref:DUF1592 domain-containing protein n=1 Tax=Luteolibacter arcticus TaxID=1581411 RepID=A0ABT3GNL3_9BACT|nr:hypothetical protein [Luteolibacter arcticus]MCW1925102.1 hypothetical protein [Luteolibacter arcticus]
MMFPRAVSLCLLSCAVLRGQEPPPPPAIPVEEPEQEPTPVVPDQQPVPVAPGGNVPRPKPTEQSVSESGMFRVRGGDALRRSSVVLGLEQVRQQFLDLLRDQTANADKPKRAGFQEPSAKATDNFKVPVNVEIISPGDGPAPARRIEFGLFNIEGQLSLSIRIHSDPGIDQERLERAAFTVLLYERALRTAKPGDLEDPLVVRPWLVEGLVEARKWREGSADRRLYEGVFRRGGGFTMDEMFELSDRSFEQLDSASRLSFRALSGALVMALLEQPQGKEAFRNFCGEAARFSGEMPVLMRKHFPDLNLSEKSLAKWWALTLAKLVQPALTEVLPVLETERDLSAALQFHTRDADGNALDQGLETWKDIAALEETQRAEAVRPAEDGLVRLSYRCFPSYRPIIQEYQQILRDIVAGKDSKLEERLAELSEQRLIRAQRATHARDYLDFFEISRARDLSGEFDDYMKLKKELEERPRPKRTDRLTEVLDTMQKAYEPKVKR